MVGRDIDLDAQGGAVATAPRVLSPRQCEQDMSALYVLPEFGGMEVKSAVYRRQAFRPHFHESYLIGVTVGGAELFRARGASHAASPGALRFFNPGEVHTGMPPSGSYWAYRCAYPSVDLVDEIASELAGRPQRSVCFSDIVVSDHGLAARLAGALASLDRPVSALERSTHIRAALAAIISTHGRIEPRPVGREPRAVMRTRTYIIDNAARDFTLRDLSAVANLSPFHLLRVFKIHTGLTPFEFQNQIRVESARRDLALGMKVGDVAIRNGFCDRSHLARIFRATVGINPLAYRRVYREKRTARP